MRRSPGGHRNHHRNFPLWPINDYWHVFDEGNPLAEKNTKRAVLLTSIMMMVEIAGGWSFNSMALLADGWHMSSHALALGLSVLA
ncbi:cation transporter [Crenobacter cavernae]|uniref:cation transporter n=1 Tax=Crenobacter cavernae TaxID=2290923 RepID=UPI002482BA89|nr:cation transporter [Crenobacter cavernae]